MSSQLKSRYDIVINGGGIVGFTLLNLILKSPHLNRYKVLLIEQANKPSNFKQPPRYREKSSGAEWSQMGGDGGDEKNFSNRVSSITGQSLTTLKKLGVWDKIQHFTKEVHLIKVWNYDYSHKIVFEQDRRENRAAEGDRPVMFSVVENNRLSLALLDNIHKISGGKEVIRWNSCLKHLDGSNNNANLIEIVTQDVNNNEESSVDAPLVLGCDGFKSRVRDIARIGYREMNLNKTAVVGTVKMANPCMGNDIAFQRFSPEKDTVAALLPLDKEYSSFVISAPNKYAKYLTDCDDETFCQEFNRLLSTVENPQGLFMRKLHDLSNGAGNILQGLRQNIMSSMRLTGIEDNFPKSGFEESPALASVLSNSRASFPLFFGTTTPKMIATLPGRYDAQLALLGDSTHRVHPLAGQGLNLGIQDAIELVKQLETIAKIGERLFDVTDLSMLAKALRRYELRRQAYVVPMMIGILSMPHLFTLLPDRILSTVNRCEPVKSLSVKFANGC